LNLTALTLDNDAPHSIDGATEKISRRDDIGAPDKWAPDATIYINRDGVTEGPYSAQEIRKASASGKFQPADKVWSKDLKKWTPILTEAKSEPVVTPLRKTCPQCQAEMSLQIENPNRGTGVIVLVLGILFAPLCVGIPLIVWGATMAGETRSHWHCRGCGRTFPL
jgi:hypothetical protein